VPQRYASPALFCLGCHTLDLLNAVQDLTLIISEEFTINDSAMLEKLTKANKRSVRRNRPLQCRRSVTPELVSGEKARSGLRSE
jgi:hypothetical protein